MIWMLFVCLACKNEAIKAEKPSVKDEIKTEEQAASKFQSQSTEETSASGAPEKRKNNAGEIHTQIGKKDVAIKYEHMETLSGTTDGKKIKGLDIKIGNMNITVDDVEIEGLTIEKKEAK